MKKFLAGIAAAAIITVPMTSFALEAMSKGSLKKATGQAGVSIAIDDLVIVQKSMPTTTYWDMDGTSSITGTVGQVNQAGLRISYTDVAQKMMVIDGILNADKYGTDELQSTFNVSATSAMTGINTVGIAETAATDTDLNPTLAGIQNGIDPTNGNDLVNAAGVYRNGISPLSIDVGTCASLTAGLSYNRGATAVSAAALDVAGVVIGLPTLEITTYHTDDTKIISVVVGSADVSQTANSGSTVPNVSNEMIRITKTGVSQMAILGGRVEIAPH